MAYEDKTAQAVCTFAYCEGPGFEPLVFEGRVNVSLELPNTHKPFLTCVSKGRIVPARGPTNFGMSAKGNGIARHTKLTSEGWDPIFEYEGETYAEMEKAKKNGLSHRALALAKLKQWLQTQT